MEQNTKIKVSILQRIFYPLFFVFLTLMANIFFGYYLIKTITLVITLPNIIYFSKGAFYLFGAAIGISTLTIMAIYKLWFNKEAPSFVMMLWNKGAIYCLIITFVLPQIVHYPVEAYLFAKGYAICEPASHQWLLARGIVYVNSPEACIQAVIDKQKNYIWNNQTKLTYSIK